MKDWEKISKPHCLYRLFDAAGRTLYIGCSIDPFSRIGHHGNVQSWRQNLASATFEWYPDQITGMRAEAAAILIEGPIYNRLVINPDRCGIGPMEKALRKPRGDGVTCPRCKGPKRKQTDAYCLECSRAYQAERRLRLTLS